MNIATTSSFFNRSLFLSIVAHIVIISVIWYRFDDEKVSVQEALASKISVGIRTAAAGTTAAPQIAPQQETKKISEPEQPTPEPPKETEPEPVEVPKESPKVKKKEKPKPKPKETEKPVETKKIEPKPKEVVEKKIEPKETPKPQEKVEPKPPKESQPLQNAQVNGASGIDGSTKSDIKLKETGLNQQVLGELMALYELELRQHLNSFKKFPRSMKLKRKEGSVEVAFVIDNQGNLVTTKFLKRKGHREFQKATSSLFKNALPLPKPPLEVKWKQKQYQLTFHYDLD